MTASRHHWLVASLAVGVVAIAVLRWQDLAAIADSLASQDWVAEAATRAGPWLVVALVALAIVASPIPSGPIAMASGALYGTVQGGLLVAAGAVLGAMIAFGVSRRFGRRALSASSRPLARWLIRPRSQTLLMLAVLATRLIPFISFDAVSYVAGLTGLAAWRFAVATVLGVMPVSFAFAAMGAGMVEEDSWRIAAASACVVTLLLPLGLWLWRAARGARGARPRPPRI